MTRQGSLSRAATHVWVAGLLDVAAIALWLLGLNNVLSRHPWVFMLLGLVAFGLEVSAIVLARIAWSRDPRSRVVTISLVLGGALPPTLVLAAAIIGGLTLSGR